ncbi:MAG: hypothetical protein WDN08_07695 [Rhizomicrobium sp.]
MRRERGLALVSVLWGIAILSLIAAAMLSASVTSARIGHNTWNAARAGAAADAAVNQAILALLDERAAQRPRVDGTPATLGFDGLAARVWIEDETGKVNLNFASKELLQGLFVSAGLAGGEAGALADRIVARRGDPNDPRPRLAFRAADEVLSVSGMTRALFDRIAPALTVYGKSGALNTQVAPRAALRALPGMSETAVERVLERREEARDAPAAAGGPLGTAGSDFQITAEVSADGARVVRVAVVQFTGDAAKPYLILAWR